MKSCRIHSTCPVNWRILRLFTFPSPFCPSLSLRPFFFFSSFLFWHSRFFTGKTWNKLLDCRVWKQYWFLCLCLFIMRYPLRLKNETLLSLFYLIKTKQNTHTQTQNHTNRKNFRFMGRFWHLNVKTLCLNVSILQSYCSWYEGGTTIASYSDFFLSSWMLEVIWENQVHMYNEKKRGKDIQEKCRVHIQQWLSLLKNLSLLSCYVNDSEYRRIYTCPVFMLQIEALWCNM